MGIQVQCPHGHVFRVKDKYAGKKGLCPHCDEQVVVHVPDVSSAEAANKAYRQAVINEHRAENPVGSSDSYVFDESQDEENSASSSGSMLGSSVIRHRVKCGHCGEPVPMWFAKCPNCGEFLEHY